jgi:hypothetical protein
MYTIEQMIMYCEKYIHDLQHEPEIEPWMENAIEMETAIVEVLKSVNIQQSTVDSGQSTVKQFNEDYIGQLIRQRITLDQQVLELSLMVEGANQPENIAGYRETLRKRQEELAWTKEGLRAAKRQHLAFLEQRLARVYEQLKDSKTELIEMEDLNGFAKQLTLKIELLKRELETL